MPAAPTVTNVLVVEDEMVLRMRAVGYRGGRWFHGDRSCERR